MEEKKYPDYFVGFIIFYSIFLLLTFSTLPNAFYTLDNLLIILILLIPSAIFIFYFFEKPFRNLKLLRYAFIAFMPVFLFFSFTLIYMFF